LRVVARIPQDQFNIVGEFAHGGTPTCSSP
jgi:hypothetical protein